MDDFRDSKGRFVKGKIIPTEWRKLVGRMNSGKNNPMFGVKMSVESRKKMSVARLGKKLSEKTRQKMSKNNSKYWTGKKHSETSKQRMREKRRFQKMPIKDTKPERMLQLALKIERITFETHKPIMGQPDIFIEPNICIFVDGDYWHRLHKTVIRDNLVNHELWKQGYHVIRMWESDILTNSKQTARNIMKLVNQFKVMVK